MSENLLPCPFCGKPAEARWLPINGSVKKEIFGLCGCNPCDVTFFSQTKFVEGQEKEALSQAIAAWNRRVTPQGGQPASLSFLEQREIAEIRNGLTSSMMNKPIWDLTEAEDKIEVLLKMLDKMQFGQPAKCPECGSNMTRFGSSDMCGPETITFFNECRRCKKVYPVVQPAEPVEGAPALEKLIEAFAHEIHYGKSGQYTPLTQLDIDIIEAARQEAANRRPATGDGKMSWALHHRGTCELCAGCTNDEEFDYCRACGFTILTFETKQCRYVSPGKSGLDRLGDTIKKARGGDAPPPMQKGYA